MKGMLQLVIVLLAGLLLIGFGTGMLSLAAISPTEISKNGVTVQWYAPKFSNGYNVYLAIKVPKNSTHLVWGDMIYVWVSREATFKRYDEVSEKWEYYVGGVTLWGKGGSAKLSHPYVDGNYYVYWYTVDFQSATSSWTTGSSWEFDHWGNKGTVTVAGITLLFQLPIQNLPPPQQSDNSPNTSLTPDEATPPQEPKPDVVVSSGSVNLAYIVAVGLVALVAVWLATQRRRKK
jgi:hypothetical protein